MYIIQTYQHGKFWIKANCTIKAKYRLYNMFGYVGIKSIQFDTDHEIRQKCINKAKNLKL